MKVAFCSVGGSDDRQYWSGTPYFMARHLGGQSNISLATIGPLQTFSKPFTAKHVLYERVFHQAYLPDLEPVLHSSLSAEVDRKVQGIHDAQVIFSPGCFPYPNTFLRSTVPVVFWADATFSGLLRIFPQYQNLCDENIWCAQQLQQQMLERSSLAIFASEWAARSAQEDYNISPEKIKVVPFGANLHLTIEDPSELESVLSRRDIKQCRLLFTARNWHQRNGDFVLEIIDSLKARGVSVKLLVAGCAVPDTVQAKLKGELEVIEQISKDNGEMELSYTRLIASAHFLLHPSQNTCFGIAINEANAWGVPALAHDSGGVRSTMTSGKNGRLFSGARNADEYARTIESLWTNYDSYLELSRSSWREYKTRLNWSSATSAVSKLLEELL